MGASANTFDIQAVWDAQYQITHYKQPVYRAFATEKLTGMLKKGDTIHRTYSSNLVANDMGADGSYSTQGLTDSDETLIVNAKKEISFYIAEYNELQNQLPVRVKYARKAMNALFLQIDGEILAALYKGAAGKIDAGTLGGTAGTPIVASVGNILNIFSGADAQLRLQNVVYDPNARFSGEVKQDQETVMPVTAVSPQVYSIMTQYLSGKNSAFGDKVSVAGNAGMFQGFNVFVSNNLGWSASFLLPTNITAGDTITINGVTLTARATPSVAGEFVVASTAAKTITNLVAALNAPGTTISNTADTGFVALSAANQALLKNFVAAVDGTTTTTMNLTASGWGSIVVSAVVTAAANKWTNQTQHNVFGVNNSIDVVIQQKPNFLINPVTGKVGKDFVTWTLYGYKVFKDQSFMLVDVQIDSSNFVSPTSITY